jgi:hypothetical protein
MRHCGRGLRPLPAISPLRGEGLPPYLKLARSNCPFSKGAVGWVPTGFCRCSVVIADLIRNLLRSPRPFRSASVKTPFRHCGLDPQSGSASLPSLPLFKRGSRMGSDGVLPLPLVVVVAVIASGRPQRDSRPVAIQKLIKLFAVAVNSPFG